MNSMDTIKIINDNYIGLRVNKELTEYLKNQSKEKNLSISQIVRDILNNSKNQFLKK